MNILKLPGGKNNRIFYYAKNAIRMSLPEGIYRPQLEKLLSGAEKRKDFEYILKRVSYYNKLATITSLPENSPSIGSHKLKGHTSSYFFDSKEYLRWFEPSLKWNYLYGDIVHVPDFPTIVKSRPITEDNTNSVLLKLNKLRHFTFLKDTIPFREKKNISIFRGHISKNKPHRVKFIEMYHDSNFCDVGCMNNSPHFPKEWVKPKITLNAHLDYKFIIALQGNDVASNLKWIMSSNSVAVMPEPTNESWFMEGSLIADHHYIRIKDDYTDLEERLDYFMSNPKKCEGISINANEYVAQFFDKEREDIISLMVLDKYFKMTGQR